MDLFAFTRALVDIESVTGNEERTTVFVADFLARAGFQVELWEVEPHRANIFARLGQPLTVLSTHLDTVPPFIPSSEDEHYIYGRGACDAKGIVAAQVFAGLRLQQQGERDFGLLFLVGEEKNSTGALAANLRPVGSQFLVNGEPTESRMVEAGKGTLRVDLVACGRMAHSAYPELGESAIEKLLLALERLRGLPLPHNTRLGPTTLNIGTLQGGRAPNVVPDHARAELLYRLVEPAVQLRPAIQDAVQGLAEAQFVLEIPPVFPLVLPGFATSVVAFTTDIPSLSAWGQPILFGPGSIHVAHTERERIAKQELAAAVAAYAEIVLQTRDPKGGAGKCG
ncbi:MAG: M20/M25/M40 family metallo-hydrolase [Terriglobales bacterium]